MPPCSHKRDWDKKDAHHNYYTYSHQGIFLTSLWVQVHYNLCATCCLQEAEWLCLRGLVDIISTVSSPADKPSSVTQRHSSTLGSSTKEFCIPVCDEITVTLSSTAFLSHTRLTTWTWSQMYPLQFLFHSHCSLATSCWMICADMAALHQLHDEELWRAY